MNDFTTPTLFVDGPLGLVLLDSTNMQLKVADRGNSFAGTAINSFIERRGMNIDPDNNMTQHQIREAWIVATGSGTLDVRIRAVEAPGRPVDLMSTSDRYLAVRSYELAGERSDYKITPRTEGRYFNIRIGTNDDTSAWSLIQYQLGI